MPTYRDVTVQVCDNKGNPLEEYGTITFNRSQRVSSYVRSVTDMEFRIKITPTIPFPEFHQQRCPLSGPDETIRKLRVEEASYLREQKQAQDGPSIRSEGNDHDDWVDMDENAEPEPDNAPWHILASLYLDGHGQSSRSCIIYLDANNSHFRASQILKSRWARDPDGQLRAYCWVFKEVGIETLLDQMLLGGEGMGGEEGANTLECVDQDFVDLMESKMKLDQKEETCKGFIKVVLERVTIGEYYKGKSSRGALEQDLKLGASGDGGRDAMMLSHTAKLGNSQKLDEDRVSIVTYERCYEEGPPYATFYFYYRSQEILEKMNLIRKSKPDVLKTININRKYSIMTPLSISTSIANRMKPKTSKKRTRKELIKLDSDWRPVHDSINIESERHPEKDDDDSAEEVGEEEEVVTVKKTKVSTTIMDFKPALFALPKKADFEADSSSNKPTNGPEQGNETANDTSKALILRSPSLPQDADAEMVKELDALTMNDTFEEDMKIPRDPASSSDESTGSSDTECQDDDREASQRAESPGSKDKILSRSGFAHIVNAVVITQVIKSLSVSNENGERHENGDEKEHTETTEDKEKVSQDDYTLEEDESDGDTESLKSDSPGSDCSEEL